MKNLCKVIILMGFIVLSTYGGAYALKLYGISEGYPTKVIPFISMIIWTIIFLKNVDHKSFADIRLVISKSAWIWSGIFSLLALGPLFIGIIINKGFILSKPINWGLIGMILYYFLVGFSEELLCRGYIYNVIDIDKLKVIIPSLAFASFHFISPEFNIILFIILFVNGIIYIYLYQMVRSLLPLISFHLIWDLGANYTNYYSNPLIDFFWLIIMIFLLKFFIKMKRVEIKYN